MAILMLIYYMWTFYDGRKVGPNKWMNWGMLAAPYVTFAVFAIAAGVVGPLLYSRDEFRKLTYTAIRAIPK